MTWKKEPAWTKDVHFGCLNCGSNHRIAPMTMLIAVGFGGAVVTKDGEIVIDGERAEDWVTVEQAEKLAAADPDHDWRIELDAPLSYKEYQRHAPGEWVLIKSGRGFA
jgi:hypothetical protein